MTQEGHLTTSWGGPGGRQGGEETKEERKEERKEVNSKLAYHIEADLVVCAARVEHGYRLATGQTAPGRHAGGHLVGNRGGAHGVVGVCDRLFRLVCVSHFAVSGTAVRGGAGRAMIAIR